MTLPAVLLVAFQASASTLQLPARLSDCALSGESHSYTLTLQQGDALVGAVEQKGIDVVVVIRDARGTVVFEVDSPNGADGAEPIVWIASSAGSYRLEVRPFEPASSGVYDLVLEAPRRATTRDRELAEALSSYLIAFRERGEALRLQGIGRFASSHPLYLSAKKQAIKALAMRTRQLGRDAVEVAPLHQLLGLIEDEIGEYRSGVHHFSRALAILESAYGREHAGTITTRSDLGHLLLAAGDYDRAEAIFREVLAHRERSGDQVRGANALVALGDTLSRAGRLDAAEPMLRRAVSIWESTVGGDHPSAVSAMSYLGAVLVRRGSTAEGEAICSSLDARLQGVAGQSHHRALIDRCLSEAALGRRDFAAASARAESMVRILEAAYGPDGPQVAEGLAFQGAVLTDAGDVASGRGTLERALRIQRRRLGDQHPSTASTIRALARTRAAGAGPRR